MRRYPGVLLLIVSVPIACAPVSSRPGLAACALSPADSVHLAGGPVYRDPPPGGKACYTTRIEFVVDTAGRPEPATTRVMRTNNPAFSDAVVATLPTWRYQPARKNGVAVRQIVREERSMAVEVVVVRPGDVPRPGRPPPC